MHPIVRILFFGSALLFYGAFSGVPCPNKCSGHGACSGIGATCECFPGYHGPDCSSMLCPAARAWFDAPYASNRAHADFTECANMGHCNRQTGECECRAGFTGPACDIMQCPNGTSSSGTVVPCSGNGRCMSLREVANYQDFEQFFNRTSYSDWDADMVHGCDCDLGWEGAACNLRSCPRGDDPYSAGVEEVQLIDCTCTGGDCDDMMQLTFKGKKTLPFRMDATEEVVRYRLEHLSTIERVSVNIFGQTFCPLAGSVTRIIFHLPQGDVPPLELTASSSAVYTADVFTDGDASALLPGLSSVAATTEYVMCSNHGECNHATGACDCFEGYGSSDGFGNAGTRGDCGYQYLGNVTWNVTNVTSVTTMCPYVYVEQNQTRFFCSGHGSCNVMTGKCTCDAGYEGGGCERRTCGTANAWFGDIKNKHTGTLPCAGVGDCDYTTGKCTNCGGGWGTFYGDQCEYLSCASTSVDTCSGNGVCLSLREMALLTYNNEKELAGFVYDEPWDADMVRGCACYRSWTVDNKYISEVFPPGHVSQTQSTINFNASRFYRGPYAFAVSDFIGYDCSHGKCPTGINPALPNTGVNEVQLMTCQADTGSFTLTFRENTTEPIFSNATAAELETALERLYTIHDVTVSQIGGSTICDFDGSNVTIEFVYEFGDLPLLTADTNNLIDSGNPGNLGALLLNITEHAKGTKIDVECSAQGICDTSRGVCECTEGYMSSGGDITSPGERGDCSYYNKYYTVKRMN